MRRKFFHYDVQHFLQEDGISVNFGHTNSLPKRIAECVLKIKSPTIIAGLEWFCAVFDYLGANPSEQIMRYEGQHYDKGEIAFTLPINVALLGERVALNLLQRASSIASFTHKFVAQAKPIGIAILDTRKTTPGLRALEKYAVKTGGGKNHRFSQTDMWMVKNNHKNVFGSVDKAITFFQKLQTAYTPLLVEIHHLNEIELVQNMGVKYLMLDNFSPEDVRTALALKKDSTTYEVSGGITLKNISNYLIEGVDAISLGCLTQAPPPVDIALKIQ